MFKNLPYFWDKITQTTGVFFVLQFELNITLDFYSRLPDLGIHCVTNYTLFDFFLFQNDGKIWTISMELFVEQKPWKHIKVIVCKSLVAG